MIDDDDLRAATAAGIIDEAQAARIGALAHQRAGRLAKGLPEDEPFELFRGFAEIFVSLGLILLISSAVTFATVIGGIMGIMVTLAGLCWVAGLYFTLKRRMTLPSIVLATGYALGVGGLLAWVLQGDQILPSVTSTVAYGLLGIGAMLLHFRTFRVPFSMFLAGLFGLSAVFGFTVESSLFDLFSGNWEILFDLRQGSDLAIATLVFGLLAFCAALWFDLQDPHRVGRLARSAFWLHLLAAPALVNTVMMTAYNNEGMTGMVLTILGLGAVTVLALVIDRRSFLTAGLGYLAAVILGFLEQGNSDLSIPTLMLVLGGIITYLGTFWTNLRVRLMRALPDFPGKSRLPPYSEAT